MKAPLTLELLVREWMQRPGRFCLTLASVAIGTAAVFGALLATASARQAYRETSASLEGPPALELVSEQGGRFPAGDFSELKSVDGISTVIPLIYRTSLVRLRERRANIIVVGVDLSRAEIAGTLRLRSGTLPTASDQALLSAALADVLQLQQDESVTLLTRRGLRKLRVSGLVERESLQQLATGAGVVLPLATVQELFSLRGQIDRVRLDLAPTADRDKVQAAVAALIRSPLIVQQPQGRIRLAEELMRSADLALMMACTMAAAMAAFIVLNTVRINVSERRRQLAIMRCIGATTRQVERLVLVEAFVAGLAGALLGVPLGYGFGWGLARGIEQVLLTHIPALTPNLATALVPVVSGPVLALVAAWIPARQTRKISPLEGLRETELSGYDRFPWGSVIAGIVLWLLGGVCVLGVMLQWFSPLAAIPSAVLMLVAYVLWLPALLRPMLRGAVKLFFGRLQLAAQLGSEQLLRRQTRTGLTAGVVVVALNSSVGLGHAILNNVRDVREWYQRTFAGDFFLQPLSSLLSSASGQEDPLREALADIPGVKAVDTIRLLPGQASDQPVVCLVREFPATIPLPLQLTGASESQARAAMAQGQVILGTVLAQRLHLHPGDSLLVVVNGRSHRFQICALTSDYFQGGMAVYMDRGAAQQRLDAGLPDYYSVHLDANSLARVEPLLRGIAQQHNAGVFSNLEGRARFDRKINGIVGSLWSVVGLTFLASGLGIANTLSVNVLEQTRELGLMRIVGMTTGQLHWLIQVEAWMLGLVGIVLGMSGGMATAYITHLCNDYILGHSPPFAWHAELLAISVLSSLLLVSLGAWGPGYRAARLDLLVAISYE